MRAARGRRGVVGASGVETPVAVENEKTPRALAPDALAAVVSFLYTDRIEVPTSRLDDLLSAATAAGLEDPVAAVEGKVAMHRHYASGAATLPVAAGGRKVARKKKQGALFFSTSDSSSDSSSAFVAHPEGQDRRAELGALARAVGAPRAERGRRPRQSGRKVFRHALKAFSFFNLCARLQSKQKKERGEVLMPLFFFGASCKFGGLLFFLSLSFSPSLGAVKFLPRLFLE